VNDPLRILLVDDNPDDRVLVMRELQREFPNVQAEQIIEAKGFAQALGRGDFDLVITDYQLRWTDGLVVLRAVKARWPDSPVIMFTATGGEEIAVEAMKSGLEDYVLKSPKHFVRLPAAARSALERAEEIAARKRAEEGLRRMSVSRALVGQMLRDLQAEGRLSEGATFRAGQKLAARVAAESLPAFLDAFNDMGLGALALAEADEGQRRWTFNGDGLVETRAGSGQPTCNYARGFLCGAVTHVLGGARVAGVELFCRSMGDALCRFMVQVVAAHLLPPAEQQFEELLAKMTR